MFKMDKLKLGAYFGLGLVVFINLAAYFTTSNLIRGAEYQQLVQIKHLLWVGLSLAIAYGVWKND